MKCEKCQKEFEPYIFKEECCECRGEGYVFEERFYDTEETLHNCSNCNGDGFVKYEETIMCLPCKEYYTYEHEE